MTKSVSTSKKARKQHSPEFRSEALKRYRSHGPRKPVLFSRLSGAAEAA